MNTNQLRKPLLVWVMVLAMLLCAAPAVLATGSGYGPGRVGLEILAGNDHVVVGQGGIWNSRDKLHIQLEPLDGWAIAAYHIDMGGGEDYSPPLTPTGNPKIGHFGYKDEFTAPFECPDADPDHPYLRTLVFDLDEDLGFQWGAPWAEMRNQGVVIFLSMVQLDADNQVVQQSGAWVVPELIVWLDDVEEEGEVEEDEVVADEDSGEVVAEANGNGNGNGNGHHGGNQNGNQNWEVDESEEVVSFEGGRWGWWFRYTMGHPRTGHFIDSPVGGLHVQTPTYVGVTEANASFDYFPGEYVEISIGSIVLGSAVADHKVSPLGIFDYSDTEDNRVINLARLLQSLDIDGEPQGGIVITPEVAGVFEAAMGLYGYETLDFSNDEMVDDIIEETIIRAGELEVPILLTAQSAEDAKAHLDETLNNVMFRKNVSKTPELASSKAKMNTATVWIPALKANGDSASFTLDGVLQNGIPYYDENGDLIRVAHEAKPIVITYTDADPVTGAPDVYAAISRDDGNTWKRKNISRMGYRSSFILENGEDYYGACKKPVFQVKGNKILVAWSSKYAKGGKPLYAIDTEDEYTFDDAYYQDDIWGVAGPQRSHDYTEEGFPEVGEVPHSALWVCRGLILTQNEVTNVEPFNDGTHNIGDIVWYKPERLTSGRRDVNQIFVGAASGAGFGIVWQEDPNGVKPGKAVGPGPGWGGATTSHKTDIWYSFLKWGDHSKIDVNFLSGGDPEHDLEDFFERPKWLVPMSLPIRLSDNDVVNTDNIMVELETAGDRVGLPTIDGDGTYGYTPIFNEDAATETGDADGTHRYGYVIPGLIDVGLTTDIVTEGWYEFVNNQDEIKKVAVTTDGRLLDGDTGASRGNIFLQPYTKPNGSTSAWAIITYEETKGAGAGPPETEGDGEEPQDGSGEGGGYVPEEGKNVIYHSFDFTSPDLVSAGTILNVPECETETEWVDMPGLNGETIQFAVTKPALDPDGNIVPKYLVEEFPDASGDPVQILDYLGRPQLAYENARRGRFILQGYGAVKNSRTIMLMVYKEGEEGHGRPSDIMMRRWVVPSENSGFDPQVDNPYSVDCLVGQYVLDGDLNGDGVLDENESADLSYSQQWYWRDGPVNMSSVTPRVVTESQGDSEQEDAYGAIKVVEWDQTEGNFADLSGANPFDDSRAHRGQIRGNFVQLGFSYTPNWAAARNGNDKYDFYIRRSFDGGATWTTDPDPLNSEPNIVNPADPNYDGDPFTVAHKMTWTHPSGTQSAGTKIDEWFYFDAGDFERMHNLSQLPNAKSSVIEPRIVAVPGTIKVAGAWTGNPEDKQNPAVFYVAYGTSTNPKKDPETGEQEEPVPQDLFYSFSMDKGENFIEDTWVVNPDSDGNNAGEEVTRWGWLAKGDPEQGEVQLRMTPDGTRFYACWLDEGEEGSDITFRRIMPDEFIPVPTSSESVVEGEDDTQDDTGGDSD